MWQVIAFLVAGCFHISSANLTPVVDPICMNKYLITYMTPKLWDKTFGNNETALSLGRIMNVGDEMSCYVYNNLTSSFNVSNQVDEEYLGDHLASILETGVDIIINSITECLRNFRGFWNYEYCPNGTLVQFHGDPKTSSLYYVLAGMRTLGSNREFRLLHNDFGYYITETVSSGDICDMTGQPRVVNLQYVCGPAAGSAGIQWVREHKTCHYEVQIAVQSLCKLELLSTTGDKKFSTPLICSKESRQIKDVLHTIAEFEPTFMGNELYFLRPCNPINQTERTSLVYSGQLIIEGKPSEKETEIVRMRFKKAIGRMLIQELILLPDGSPLQNGDEISWFSEVVDLKGNFLTTVHFTINSSSIPHITFDPYFDTKGKGNVLSYKKNDKPDEKPFNLQNNEMTFESQLSLDFKDKFKFVLIHEKIDSGEQLVLDETDYILEDVLSAEQIAELLVKLESEQQTNNRAEKNKEDKTPESRMKDDTSNEETTKGEKDEQVSGDEDITNPKENADPIVEEKAGNIHDEL
ncbi:hypothetical protein HG535_0A03300 [Zygotorulaspora mrakii]|uniref:Endoplasmic reticulum lectin n=1 Tax=Zygotorulaspora mrakii TaxID=42260 RepID=A0A7H9AVY8_ZYGMR|nr:uncharacterized protein HG535_0A03300 [Zygotorulaspora mrakii]QLG70391.1 hypothetical protein HG535_0A03300 [Zygotorulaspora mrakii]